MKRHQAQVAYRVPYADTDRMGVVYYANYLVYFERVRNQFLSDIALPYRELEEQGILLPVVKAEIDYKRPAEFDDVLHIYGTATQHSPTRLRFECSVYREALLLARGYTIHAVLDKASGKPVKAPPALEASCEAAAAGIAG